MKTIYLDIFSGISGDMFIGAMLDLGLDFHQFEDELKKLGLGGYHLHVSRQQRGCIDGTKFDVRAGSDEDPSAAHTHAHEHTHGDLSHTHEHSHLRSLGHAHSRGDDSGETHEHGQHYDHLEGNTRGPHGGPLVARGLRAPGMKSDRVEVSVFETNTPPRFRLYFFDEHGHVIEPMAAKNVTLETIRKGGRRQRFAFKRQGQYLEATEELPEPHEFKAVLRIKRGARVEKIETQFVEDHPHHAGGADGAPHGHGRTFDEIQAMIQQSGLSSWVKAKAVAVFHRVARAEGKIHGQPPADVHFHEVGAVDSIVDIVGACIALDWLGRPRLLAAPVVDGTGWVECAHGRFPVPTPATLEILGARGVPVSQCEEPHELVTPTGAALLAELVESFGPMRELKPEKIGYGLGQRENQIRPNVLRAILGETSAEATHDWETDTVAVLEANLDDINAELLGHFAEKALAQGALDVFYTAVQMKKNRPGVLLNVLCADREAEKFSELILRETTSFGVRRRVMERRKLRRELKTVSTRFGQVQIKIGKLNGQIVQCAPEFESCRRLAEQQGVTVKEIYDAALRALNV